jgi:malate dehydrogenase (oxaloacetate-decarboxylating)
MTTVPTAAYSIGLKIELDNVPGTLGRFAVAIGEAGGNIAGASGFEAKGPSVTRIVDVHARDEAHSQRIVEVAKALSGVTVVDWWDRTFRLHEGGKIEVLPLCSVGDAHDLAMAYTPGVARVCMAIHGDRSLAHDYTIKKNTVAIVSDGTAVLGLGDIGPEAAMPVMEGKALLFKEFAGVDGFPICLDTKDPDEIIATVQRIAPTFGGINLEDIAAPNCFVIEDALKKSLDIPVFHDDQHGTAVVTLAGLTNALKIVDKRLADCRIVISGMGAAGVAIGKILRDAGATNIVGVDSVGIIHPGRDRLNFAKEWFAEHTNPERMAGSLQDALRGADIFVGVSAPNLIDASDLRQMAKDPIVFAMANPDPEIRPETADGLAAVMATGRSDFPNQINNVLAFPGIFRGAFDVGAHSVTESMKVAAAEAIAKVVTDDELRPDFVVPSVFDRSVAPAVASAVANAAVLDGAIRS